jgi:hypothetical protein
MGMSSGSVEVRCSTLVDSSHTFCSIVKMFNCLLLRVAQTHDDERRTRLTLTAATVTAVDYQRRCSYLVSDSLAWTSSLEGFEVWEARVRSHDSDSVDLLGRSDLGSIFSIELVESRGFHANIYSPFSCSRLGIAVNLGYSSLIKKGLLGCQFRRLSLHWPRRINPPFVQVSCSDL